MARGWESKSVEMQIEDASSLAQTDDVGAQSEEDVRLRSRREGLMLQRSRILEEISFARNPRYRKMLEETLAQLESQLQAFLPEAIVNRQS